MPDRSESNAGRLTAGALPPYSYVTGRFPHPNRDENGHSFHAAEPKCSIEHPDDWQRCEPYLRGIDLFNHGYYWEAHESWEAVWLAAGRKGVVAAFCQALIKLAASGVKAREGRVSGVERHAARAGRLLDSVARQISPSRQCMGLLIDDLRAYALQLEEHPSAVMDTSDDCVVIVMPFILSVQRG